MVKKKNTGPRILHVDAIYKIKGSPESMQSVKVRRTEMAVQKSIKVTKLKLKLMPKPPRIMHEQLRTQATHRL